MKKQIILILTASFFTGCATTDKGQRVERHSGPTTVAPAVEKLSQGDSPGAAKMLKTVCKGKAVSGVTDEALFRLALLSLKPNPDMLVSKRGRELLKRLKKEYPASPWTAQAAPLIELIKLTDELTHQNQDLKAAKESLTRKINELNHNIKQLKYLDLELEKTR